MAQCLHSSWDSSAGVRLTTHSSCGHWSTTAESMAAWSWPPTCHCKLVSSNVLVPLNHNIVISAWSWFLHMPMVSSMCGLHVYDVRLWRKYWWDLLIVIAPGLFHYFFILQRSNGNIFLVTGHFCGEFTGPRWIPCTKASDAELWCFLWPASE